MQILLRLKNWQLFLLTSLSYINVVTVPLLILHMASTPGWHLAASILTVVGYVAGSLWLLILATELYKKLPNDIEIKIGLFLFLFYIEFSYQMMVAIFGILRMLTPLPESITEIYRAVSLSHLTPFITVSISLATTIYCCYVVSKLLNTVEEKEITTNVNDIVSLVFFPIGLWWIQPRVNKIFNAGSEFMPNTPLDQNITQEL